VNRGFTLVELMVIIGLLGVLIVAMPPMGIAALLVVLVVAWVTR